ncbi:MAG TPA: histidine kinase [Bacillota bacterium]
MKLGIKAKILGATGLVVMISLMLSGIWAYYYFQKIFKEKAIKDDAGKIDQIAQQMEYQIDDIRKYATSMIIIPEVQDFIKQSRYASYYEQLVSARRALGLMMNQLFLREYIHSAAVITISGSVWYTDLHTMPHDYFKSKLKESWYQRYLGKKDQFYFSDPYQISNYSRGTAAEPVISYIVQMHDVDQSEKINGRLFLNVFLSHFEKNILTNSKEYDAFYWVNQDGTIIYQRNSTPKDIRIEEVRSQIKASDEKTSVIENAKGYLILNHPLSNGWRLISFTSNRKMLQRINFIFIFFLCFTLISLAVIIVVVFPIILRITNPITELTEAMKQVASGNLDTSLQITSGDELETMANGFNRMVVDLKNHLAKSVEYERVKRKMEYDILLSQINPHFIYNVLDTVIYMARKKKDQDTVNLLGSFIRILQDGIKVGGDGLLTTVKQEVEMVNHYVTIQEYRYRGRFTMKWEVEETVVNLSIPRSLIQPLVENALYHGICPKDETGVIKVVIRRDREDLEIRVEDDGVGMEKGLIAKLLAGEPIYEPESRMRPIGIANIRDRIRYLYGKDYGLTIESTVGKGTVITVKLPMNSMGS